MTAPKEYHQPPTITDAATLGFISSLGPFAVNAYVPGFHRMAEDLGVSFIAIQQSLTLYLVSYAAASLFAGTASDAFGRKASIVWGMIIFMFASAGVIFSDTLLELCIWRIVQGLGASVSQVVTQAIVRDRWEGLHATRMNALIAMFFAVSPALAPVVGGWLIIHWDWHAVFVFLIIYAAGIALVARNFITETLPPKDRRPLHFLAVTKNYAQGLTHPALIAGAAAHGACFMGGIVYSAGAADFVIKIMHFEVDEFAWLTFPLIGFGLAGSWASARLAQRFGAQRTIYTSVMLMIIVTLSSTVFDYLENPVYPLLLLGPVLYQFGMSVVRPIMMAMNLDYFPHNRGMAASIQQAFLTGGFAVSTALWVPLAMGSAWKYSAVMFVSALLVLVLWSISLHARKIALKNFNVPEDF